MSDKEKALVIAGGAWQKPLIQYLKDRGYLVVVADPYDDSPGVLISDSHIRADVRDVESIKKIIGGDVFSLITTDQSDIAVDTVVELSNYMGLSSNSPEAVKKFTNKFISRKYAVENGIPVPNFKEIRNFSELVGALEVIQLPAILKPVDAQSSKGIHKMIEANTSEWELYLEDSFRYTKQDYVLIESFFEGVELTVEGICSGSKHKTLAISRKKHFRVGIASDLIYPADIPTSVESEIIDLNDRYVERSGLEYGITHAEYLYNESSNKICLVEIACRGGGTLISSDIIHWVSGVDVYKIHVDNLKGNRDDVKGLRPSKRPALLHFFEFPNGTVEAIEGLAEAGSVDGVRALKLDFKVGEIINKAKDDRSRQGFVIIFAETSLQLQERLDKVQSQLKVKLRSV